MRPRPSDSRFGPRNHAVDHRASELVAPAAAPVGGLATLGFYALLQSTGFGTGLLGRYFASHPVEIVATLLFFVGAAALVLRAGWARWAAWRREVRAARPIASGGQPCGEAGLLVQRLDDLHGPLRKTLLVRRLRAAIDYVRETGSADTLEDELVRLEDADRDRVAAGYALPRLIRATLPIIGMLGTVIGITLAIGQLSPDQLEESLTEVMAALSVAFDTTAQAMSLMLVLWFAMFGVERVEERLLDEVDAATRRQCSADSRSTVADGPQRGGHSEDGRRGDHGGRSALSPGKPTRGRARSTKRTNGGARRRRPPVKVLTTSLANGLRDGLRDHATGLSAGIRVAAGGPGNESERTSKRTSRTPSGSRSARFRPSARVRRAVPRGGRRANADAEGSAAARRFRGPRAVGVA